MKKVNKILSLVLAVLILVSVVSVGANAATTISYSPNPKVEYSYSSGVTTGTIRYISQINGSTYFNSNYWGGWASQAGIECGTASISMALSYVGVNKTPKTILDVNNGITYFTGWGVDTKSYSYTNLRNAFDNYLNGNGKYSPPIIHLNNYSSAGHFVVLIGHVSSNQYKVLDPANATVWTITINGSSAQYNHPSNGKYINDSIDRSNRSDDIYQYYNASASITHSHSYDTHYEADHPHRVYKKCSCGDWYYTGETKYLSSCSACNEPTKIIYPTNGGIYKIASGVGNNMYLDFACSSNNVQIYENCDGHSNPDFVKSQYYKFTHVGDGWYTITNPANGKAMDVYDWRTASGTNIQQWDLHSGDCQLFRFYDAGNGYCYIKSKLGTYVDVANGDNVNNTNVWAYSYNGSNAQKWKLQSHSHSYSSKVTTAATCTKTGVKTFTCYCGVSYTETIAKKAHSYTSSVTTQPTCTKEGVRTYKCSCGTSYTETIAKTSHNSNTKIPAVTATCTKTGLTEGKKCSVCGTITVAQQTVAKKAHTIVTDNAVSATCIKTGLTEGKHCSVCNTVTVAQQTVTTVSHIDNNGDYKCDYNCGYEFEKPVDPTPDTPDEPENPDKDNCSCMCHASGLWGLIWKILRFFYKFLGLNDTCVCGVAHY